MAVLANSTVGEPLPTQTALKIAALTIGKPYRDPVAVPLDPSRLDAYVGVYHVRADDGIEHTVTREGDRFVVQRTGGAREEILPLSPTAFFFKNAE